MKTAVVIGSTGLIGQSLIEKLAQDGTWTQILAISRKPINWNNPKIRGLSFDFTHWSELELQIQSFASGHSVDFFCCLGSTMAQAKTEEQFKKIDLVAVVQFAKLARACRADQLLIVSSMGADENSSVFYSRVKGEMEKTVRAEFTGKLHFARPSLLLGDRKQFRFGERLAILAAPIYSPLLLGRMAKYRPIQAAYVAKALVNIAAKRVSTTLIVENPELHRLGKI